MSEIAFRGQITYTIKKMVHEYRMRTRMQLVEKDDKEVDVPKELLFSTMSALATKYNSKGYTVFFEVGY